jgi:hypothetical protein
MPIVHQNDGIDPEGADGGIDCVDDINFLRIHDSFLYYGGRLPAQGPST